MGQQGRPKNVRIAGSGEKLYMALKLTGVSWGARIGPNHIAANKQWATSGLPKSINTVIEDIRSGIPVNRLDRYAAFFQVAADLFLDEAMAAHSPAFSCEILKHKHLARIGNPLNLRLQESLGLEQLNEQNRARRLYDLYELLAGAYLLFYKVETSPVIGKGASYIGEPCEGGLFTAGVRMIGDTCVNVQGVVFRWHNALHKQYYSNDFQMLGYMMTPDPLQSIVIKQRQPFCLKWYSLSGSPHVSARPERGCVCAIRQDDLRGRGHGEALSMLTGAVQRQPVFGPGDAAYQTVMDLLESPDA